MNLSKAGGRLKIILALLIFSLIVLFHEFGHFLLAKRGGIGRDGVFSGNGPQIFSKQIGRDPVLLEASALWRLLHDGGRGRATSDDEIPFGSKSVWTRISVVAAGPHFQLYSGLFPGTFSSSAVSAMTRRIVVGCRRRLRRRRKPDCSRETGSCR